MALDDEALVAAANGSALADEPGVTPTDPAAPTLDGLHAEIRTLMGPTGLRWTRPQAAQWLHQHYQVERVADLAADPAQAALALLRKLGKSGQNTSAA